VALINWLIEWTSRTETEARHKSTELIYRLTEKDDLKSTFRRYVAERHENDVRKYLEFVESCNFVGKMGIGKFWQPVTF
jgi:hypothetical protein